MASTDEAIEAIYAASLDPAGWREAAAQVGMLFHTATAAFYINRAGCDGGEIDVLTSDGHDDRSIASYMDYYANVNPFDRDPSHFAVGEVVMDHELDRRLRVVGAFENSEYYNDWVRPQNFRHVLGCHVARSHGRTFCAAFWRPADVGFYTPNEADVFARLMGHASRALNIGARLRSAESAMADTLGRGGGGVFSLGRDGRIRHCNAVADALLGAACGFVARDGHLRTAIPQDQEALDRLIACAFDPRLLGWAENARVAIRRTDGGAPLVARIVASARRFAAFVPDSAASAVLVVEGFEAEAFGRIERLRRRFGLTPAQARLAEELRSGRSLREAARQLGIGHETARSHLKGVFARTGTHRQTELVLLLRGFDKP